MKLYFNIYLGPESKSYLPELMKNLKRTLHFDKILFSNIWGILSI